MSSVSGMSAFPALVAAPARNVAASPSLARNGNAHVPCGVVSSGTLAGGSPAAWARNQLFPASESFACFGSAVTPRAANHCRARFARSAAVPLSWVSTASGAELEFQGFSAEPATRRLASVAHRSFSVPARSFVQRSAPAAVSRGGKASTGRGFPARSVLIAAACCPARTTFRKTP